MTIDTRLPERHLGLTFDVDAIANGYIVRPRGKPSPSDPLAQRGEGPPFYIRDIEDAPLAIAHMIDEMLERETSLKKMRESLQREGPLAPGEVRHLPEDE